MRMLVYGCGQLAASAIRDLAGEDMEITVLGKERSRLERLSAYPGVTAMLLTEPVMQDYLLEAGVTHADAFSLYLTTTMRICSWPRSLSRCSMYPVSFAMWKTPSYKSCTPHWGWTW